MAICGRGEVVRSKSRTPAGQSGPTSRLSVSINSDGLEYGHEGSSPRVRSAKSTRSSGWLSSVTFGLGAACRFPKASPAKAPFGSAGEVRCSVQVLTLLARRFEVNLAAIDEVRFPRGGKKVAGRKSEPTSLACWSHVKSTSI